MPSWLTLSNGLAILMAVIAAGCFAAALGTFVIGQHYLIPTFWLLFTIIAGNFAGYSLAGARWAREVVFWCGALGSSTLFMGMFFAKKPKVWLGDAFVPVAGALFLAVLYLTLTHARASGILALTERTMRLLFGALAAFIVLLALFGPAPVPATEGEADPATSEESDGEPSTEDAAAAGPDAEAARLDTARAGMPQLAAAFEPLALPCAATADAAALGRDLWQRSAAAVRAGAESGGDDRPLYWTRIATLAAAPADCSAEGAALEHASRGFTDVAFDDAADVRVLLTGFDPFGLDRDVTQSNPSGVVALQLDGLRTDVDGRLVAIETVVVPVRFADFDAGLVEDEIVPLALRERADLLVTVSMGREAFDLERFPGLRRSAAAPDNLNVLTGGSSTTPVLPLLHGEPLAGPEFVEFTLPVAAMLDVEGRYPVRDNRTVTTLEGGRTDAESLSSLAGLTAVRGGGGGYLSNEISYRVLNALGDAPEAPRSGHIHTPSIDGHDGPAIAAIVTQVEALVLAAAGAGIDAD